MEESRNKIERSDYLHRLIAKAIDFLVAGFFIFNLSWVGVLTGALYLTISDGFFSGQSVGKKLLGLSVRVLTPDGKNRACNFRDSILRNVLFGVWIVLASIPILGWLVFLPAGILFLAIEIYFIYFDDNGIRIGDIFASSRVVESAPKSE